MIRLFSIAAIFSISPSLWSADKPLFYRSVSEIYGSGDLADLAIASARGDKRKIDALLKRVDINAKGYVEAPVLFWALKNKNKVGYKYLLDNGANPNMIFGVSKKISVIHLASSMKDLEWLKITVDFQGDVNLVNSMKETPIFKSVSEGLITHVNFLIESGADVNVKSNGGYTPLQQSAMSNNFDIAQVLIDNGADWKVKNNFGTDFVDLAKRSRVSKKFSAYKDREEVLEHIKLLEKKEIMGREGKD